MTNALLPAGLARIGIVLMAAACCGASRAGTEGAPVHSIFASALDASGLDRRSHEVFAARYDALAKEVAARVGSAHSPETRARRLHRFLHRHVFVRYQEDADGLDDVLARGEFNCVSSTLLEGLLAVSLGLEARIVSGPNHVSLRLLLPSRAVDVETTIPDGFDMQRRAEATVRFLVADGVAAWGTRPILGTQDASWKDRFTRTLPLDAGPAFIWHNAAARQLARGEGHAASLSLLAGELLYPGAAAGPEGIQTELGRAFRADYDAGRFDDAYATAAIGVRIGPGVVSANDRLIAAATQRVESLADRGDIQGAESILLEMDSMLGPAASRFERHILPTLVAAAVRVGDWERAECLWQQYAAVELDATESRRLGSWVLERDIEAHSGR